MDRENTDAGSMGEIQSEVDAHFGGDWGAFLDAVKNPAEILRFVKYAGFDDDPHAFQEWARSRRLDDALVVRALEEPAAEDEPPRGGIRGADLGMEG